MWSTEKFGAVSGRRQVAALRPPIFLNPAGHPAFDDPFILSDFGAGPRPSYVLLRRKCGKLNRQTPICRNHSKSQKTNNRDLLKSPKIQILRHHNLPASGPILTLEGPQFLPFLPGSASRVEIAVTYSKQRTAQILPVSRIARKRLSNQSKSSPDFDRRARVTACGSRPLPTSNSPRATAILPGSASRVEIAVTHSKQRTAQILPGSRIARRRSLNQSKFSPEFVRGAQVAVHGSRLLLATSISLALTKEGSLATAFRYNAPCPNFSREACNLT
jgi:hypothetical protein